MKSRGCRQKPGLSCHQATKLGLRSRIVQSHQRLVGFDDIAFLDQQFSNNSAFQVLHLFILSGGDERAGRNDSAGQAEPWRPIRQIRQAQISSISAPIAIGPRALCCTSRCQHE